VPPQELGRLVEPWPAPDADLASLPLPRLVDVAFNPGREPDLDALRAQIAALAPGAMIDQVAATGMEAAGTARALRALGLGAAVLVLATLLVVVVVVTRMSLDLHQATVDLLRMMGAGEAYVGRQFELHALSNALRGGLFGFAAALVTVCGFMVSPANGSGGGLPRPELVPLDWLLLGCVPVVAAVLTGIVARRTARWGLARLR
jgi:cell division protein FtsX